jgi:hypothetical protein
VTDTPLALDRVAEAADLFGDVFRYVDIRVQKQIAHLDRTREIALELCWDDEVNLIQPGTRGSFSAPWHCDVQSVQAWCDGGPVTLQFAVAHATSPTVLTIIGTVIANPHTLLQDRQETTVLGPDDTPRTSPETGGYDLTNSGFLTELLAHDMVYVTITAGTPKLVGLKLGCVVRPISGLDANTATQAG